MPAALPGVAATGKLMILPGDRSDPAIAEIIGRLDVPGVRDLGIVTDHGDGHPMSALAADDAGSAARNLRGIFPQTGYWPLLLLDDIAAGLPVTGLPASPDMAAALAQGWRPEDLATGEQAVTLAAGLALDDAPYCGYFGGRPAMDGPGIRPHPETPSVLPRPAEAAMLGRAWTTRHGLLLVPAQAPCESLAHIGFGTWNESPSDTGHVRFQRYLQETCGSAVVAVGLSRMNVEMPRPPQDPATALLLAGRLFEYCRDLETVMSDFLDADPDEEDFTILLAGILIAGVPALPLWWD